MTTHHPRPRPFAALALLGLVGAMTNPARADLVNLIPGSSLKAPGGAIRGTILAETPAEVTVRIGSGNQTQAIPVAQIASIRYDAQPGTAIQASGKEAAGSLAEAADLYKKAAAESATKPFVAEACLFDQARVTADLGLTDAGRLDAATAMLNDFLKAHATGRHVLPALETLAKLQMQKGDYDGVASTVDRLAKIPQAADRAAVLRARVSTHKGDHTAAVAELDKLIADAPEGSVKRRDAQLAKAEGLVAMKKYADAEALVRGVIAGAAPEDATTQSIAHNTLGDCLRAAGRRKDALYAYLHTDLLFFRDKEQHPKALARISQLWREEKRDDRADEALDRLKQDYPKSPYVAQASAAKPGN